VVSWKYYIVYACWLGFEFAVVWKFYIEARNTSRGEIFHHFNGEGAISGGDLAYENLENLKRSLVSKGRWAMRLASMKRRR